MVCAVYGDGAIAESPVHKGFSRFKSGEYFNKPTLAITKFKKAC